MQLAHEVWGPLWIIAFLAILDSDVANQNAADAAAIAALVWYVIGIGYLIYLANWHPERLAETRHVFDDTDAGASDADPLEPAPATP